NPEITVIIAVAQYPVLDEYDRPVSGVSGGPISVEREGPLRVVLHIDIGEGIAAGVAEFLFNAICICHGLHDGNTWLIIQMARRPMARRNFLQCGHGFLAARHSMRASWVEGAARRRIQW